MFMFLGAFLFTLIFILLAPQPRAFLGKLAESVGASMTAWAPYSYFVLMVLVAALLAGMWVIQSWPKHVEPENPMAKYRRDQPLEDE